MTIRAIEHIGITVPDLEEATTFFADAFGAQKIYDMIDTPLSGPETDRLGVPQGATIEAIRMLRLGNGPNLELFVYSHVGQREPVLPSDFGMQHFCVYVDDIHAAAARLEKAGGELLSPPVKLLGGDEGPGNLFLYARSPWGSTIELVTYPSPQVYESRTQLRRWRPPATNPADPRRQES